MTSFSDKLKRLNLYYHDSDELGEDAFKPLGDDEVAEVVKLVLTEVIGQIPPESDHWRYSNEPKGRLDLQLEQRKKLLTREEKAL